MSFRSSLLLIAVAIVVVASDAVPAQQHQTTIPIGAVSARLGDTVVVLPAPQGFEEATQQWEIVKSRLAATEPPESDLLAGYLPVSDCDLLRKGQPALYPTWTKIAVLRAARAHDFSSAEYAGIVEYFRQNNVKLLNPEDSRIKEGMAQLDKVLSKEYSKDLKLDFTQPVSLGDFDRRPNVYSSLLISNVKAQVDGKDVPQPSVLVSVTILHIKKRVLLIAGYKKYGSKADADTLMQFTTKWINEILAAN